MKNTIPPVKGTRDFYPEEMALRTWLYAQIRRVSESFGYVEYEGPMLEPLELYAAKSGEELVKEQSFVFPDRKGNLIALRPELTPTLARLVAQRQRQLVFPLHWWSFGPMWRYEQPQRGRTREFFQWNIDLIGVDSPEADAELVAVGATFLSNVGLSPDQVHILVNNRRLMDAGLASLGIPAEQRPTVVRLIDRRERMKPAAWKASALELGLSQTQLDGLNRLLADENLWEQSEELQRLFLALEAMGVREYVRFAPYVIRGLDYYTGTVFECFDRAGKFRAIFAGGRYDNLVADVGGEPLPGVGFAMGDKVIMEVLREYDQLPAAESFSRNQILVTVFDQEHLLASLSLAAELRRDGFNVTSYPEGARLNKQFKYADRIGAALAVVLGPDELAADQVTIKDLRSRDQVTVARSRAREALREMLARQNPS